MPEQEQGFRPARPLPYQPNANLDSFTFGQNGEIDARLSFSNAGPHMSRASHFSVYDNALPTPSLADFPTAYPGQYTVDPSRSDSAKPVYGTVEIGSGPGDGAYDLTVIGPNRFLRHFTGDAAASGTAQVRARYEGSSAAYPRLSPRLVNDGSQSDTFTVTHNEYISDRPRTYHVRPHDTATYTVDPLAHSHGWYDVSVAVSSDSSWSRRYIGHLENGEDSITG